MNILLSIMTCSLNTKLPPLNNIYKTTISFPLIGKQNIEYKRIKPFISQVKLDGKINAKGYINFDMYEIDTTIKILKGIAKNKIIYGDFMKQKITKKYKTIIGNPPYIRTTKGNLYIDFIEKCYHLLQTNGELIFIIPSDFSFKRN